MVGMADIRTTEKTKSIIEDAMKELREASLAGQVIKNELTATDVMRYMADRFNGMRAELSVLVAFLKDDRSRVRHLTECLQAVSHGDYSKLITGTEVNKKQVHLEVEDAGKFAETIQMLWDKRTPETRMQACAKVNAMIAEAIKGWKSKVKKMEERTSLGGSSEGELETSQKMIVQFNEAIRVLEKRGGQVSEIYFAAKKEMTDFLKKMEDSFKVINHMEKVGKGGK